MPEPQPQQIQASNYTVSNTSQVKQSQTEAYRQASTGMRKDSQQELTNSIMTKSRDVKLNGYGQVDGEGRSGGMQGQGQGFALLRARAIHSLNMNNGVPGQMTNSVSPMPQMPQILRPKEERGMEIRNVAMVSSYNQPPMVRMNRSH